MPESTEMQVQPPEPEGPEEADTQAEYSELWTGAVEAKERFATLAKAAVDRNEPGLGQVYSEIGGAVMTLLVELIAATGGAFDRVEEDIEELQDEEVSKLIPEDADKYQQLFTQYLRLLEGLDGVIPEGAAGAEQRKLFATLRRLTEGMVEFTESITVAGGDDDDDEPQAEEEGDGKE